MAEPRIPLADRFWSKVNKTETCWLWTAGVNNKEYGRFSFYNRTHKRGTKGRDLYAHRVAWILTHGAVPGKMNILHRCDTPRCVNPEHLFLGSQAENMADMCAKGRRPFIASRSQLTPDDIRAIRSDPRKHHIIGADYGLKRMAVFEIKHRKTWSHID